MLTIFRIIKIYTGFLAVKFFAAAVAHAASLNVPVENQTKGLRPSFDTFETAPQRLVDAITNNNSDAVLDLFFPKEPFLALKDIPDAGQYYDKLIISYRDDIHALNKQLSNQASWKIKKFEPGFCKWKEPGSEYNKISYWSCYRSKIVLMSENKTKAISVRVIINWGKNWYVTHLGR